MSTNPAPPANPTPNNPNVFILGGIVIGVIVLCTGMSAMSLATVLTLGRSVNVASTTEKEPSSKRTTPSSEDEPGETNAKPQDVARKFMNHLKAARYDDAYGLTSGRLQSDEDLSAFRKRVSEFKAIRGHTKASYQRRSSPNTVTFSIFVEGPHGQGRFSMDVTAEDDGSWKVDSFGQ